MKSKVVADAPKKVSCRRDSQLSSGKIQSIWARDPQMPSKSSCCFLTPGGLGLRRIQFNVRKKLTEFPRTGARRFQVLQRSPRPHARCQVRLPLAQTLPLDFLLKEERQVRASRIRIARQVRRTKL